MVGEHHQRLDLIRCPKVERRLQIIFTSSVMQKAVNDPKSRLS